MTLSRRLFVTAAAGLAVTGVPGPAAALAGDRGRRIPVSPDDTEADLVRKASQVRPTARQIAWQRLERTAFLHFGVNTFTGLEWGTGDEDPDVFQPARLDTDQWAAALKDGGFRLAVLTVKHHDGFVLHPSRYTGHSVASSSWRNGQGDVLRSFTDSMRRYGLKVGVYISPADENQYLHGVYANGSARSPRAIPTLVPGDDRAPDRFHTLDATDYGAHMLNTLYEVLTEYGPVDEVWFDGAQGHIPSDKVESYDWDSWYTLVRALAPDAAIAVTGPDLRWVGNESGIAREDEWSVIPVKENQYGPHRLGAVVRHPRRGQPGRAGEGAADDRLPPVVARRVRRLPARRLVLPCRPAAQVGRRPDGDLLRFGGPQRGAAAERPAGHRRSSARHGRRPAARVP
ncbi:hypothetical protein RKD34_007015 [Streptomyces sp. SAI-218]